MKLAIEITAALLLVCLITVTSAAAGSIGHSADGLSCGYSVHTNATPAQRCMAIKRQCGGKFWASVCSGRLLASG